MQADYAPSEERPLAISGDPGPTRSAELRNEPISVRNLDNRLMFRNRVRPAVPLIPMDIGMGPCQGCADQTATANDQMRSDPGLCCPCHPPAVHSPVKLTRPRRTKGNFIRGDL